MNDYCINLERYLKDKFLGLGSVLKLCCYKISILFSNTNNLVIIF